jgi:hypothetical protein
LSLNGFSLTGSVPTLRSQNANNNGCSENSPPSYLHTVGANTQSTQPSQAVAVQPPSGPVYEQQGYVLGSAQQGYTQQPAGLPPQQINMAQQPQVIQQPQAVPVAQLQQQQPQMVQMQPQMVYQQQPQMVQQPQMAYQQPQQRVIQMPSTQVYQSAMPVQALGEGAAPIDCPSCHQRAITSTTYKSGDCTQ